VTFDIRRGGLQASGSLQVSGSLPIEMVRETAGIAEGVPFDPQVPGAARDRLVALYRREAFPSPDVTVKQTVNETEPVVDLAFVITEGPRQVLGDVVVTGNRAIDSDVIVRALGLQIDQPLRPEESLRARTNVFKTGLFSRVDIAPEMVESTGGPQATVPMRLKVTVEEWPALLLRYGLQVAEERPEGKLNGRNLVPGLSADLTRRTLFGRAVGLVGAVRLQRREQLERLFLTAPTLAGWPVSSQLGSNSREKPSRQRPLSRPRGVSRGSSEPGSLVR
jgi:outer membrane translocation and assembly module TamA